MIIPISEHRLKRVYAEIRYDDGGPIGDSQVVVIGQVIDDLVGIWTYAVGNVVMDASGRVWLERASYDKSGFPDRIPDAYLATSVESLKQVATLNCETGKLATLPRSQQYRFAEAERRFREWVKLNDPQCFDDPGSYWNELWRDEY